MTTIRDWAEEGATPEELALLSASRNERASAASHARTLAALGLGTAVTAATSTSIAAATTIGGTTLKLVAKIALAVVVAGGASGLAWHAMRKPASPQTAPVAQVAPPRIVEPPVARVEPPPPEVAATAPVAPSRALHPRTAASASSDTLAAQVAALEKAHAALAAHDPRAALRALDRYRTRFPDGALSSEEKVLRVKATLALGDKTRAAALASELRAADPNSPYARRVGDLVSDDEAAKH